MKTLLKLWCVALFAGLFACKSDNPPSQLDSSIRQVTSVADFALGYLIEIDSGQCDTTLAANMKRMRNLDQDFRRSGTGEGTHYMTMMSCCLCSGTCCTCHGPSIYMAGSSSITSVQLLSGDSVKSNPTAESIDGIRIFNLNTTNLNGNLDLKIDYQGKTLSIPVEATAEGALKLRMP